MDRQQAQRIIKETFEQPFDKERFASFIKNLLNRIDVAPFTYQGQFIPDAYRQHISTLMQRNFVAWYLNGSHGGELKYNYCKKIIF